jgi:hypothetical protein
MFLMVMNLIQNLNLMVSLSLMCLMVIRIQMFLIQNFCWHL